MKKPGRRARQKEYKAYLETPYWKKVTKAVVKRDRKCTKCGSTSKLEVHHLSYAHRGQELLYLYDLTTWCHCCHKEHHKQERQRTKTKKEDSRK